MKLILFPSHVSSCPERNAKLTEVGLIPMISESSPLWGEIINLEEKKVQEKAQVTPIFIFLLIDFFKS